ncbi:nesprin-4 isoform X5 [Manis pentadactyla]|uniref:nesprin-4 isoform X5 n=1 Tax=Manis pentadactyla TaxID=143292 RepID=UPI0018766FE1|nr:nesprin-4 isoform X5 [Manis pentadactyla]
MALPQPLGSRLNSEPLNHPPGAPRELDTVGCPNCPVSGEERIRLPTPSSHEDPAGGKHYEVLRLGSTGKDSRWGQSWYRPRDGLCCREASRRQEPAEEHPISGREVLEAEQDSLYLCLMGLGLWLQDLEQGLACWASAQSRMIQLQALQADLHGAAECVDAVLAFGEGLAQWSEPQARASLEQVLRALGAHRDSIFRQLWRLQAQLVSYSLDMLMSGLSYRKHLVGHQRHSLLQKSKDKRQTSPSLQDVSLEVDPGTPAPVSRWPLSFLLLLLLFLILVGASVLLPPSGGSCCCPTRQTRTPYLVLNYVNGPPPI